MASSIRSNPFPFIGIGVRPSTSPSFLCGNQMQNEVPTVGAEIVLVRAPRRRNLRRVGLPGSLSLVSALERSNSGSNSSDGKKGGVSNSNYVVPLDKSSPFSNSSCITRPLAEILRDLNKRIPDNIAKVHVHGDSSAATLIPWYHANRMLSFYAPGWCGEIRDVIFSDNGSVTVVYRVTVRGSDGEDYGLSF
ncbi:DNA repair RAD52-like protein 2, chloroplastic isoform X2 [Neltuma alba]|uniref:DNA repair RAD52-like protein 2, chloroplastic isoform X2 n=1 Tax=Neltuma alba TaxID=207710 RepID=UPI0010A3F61A|nr:DNA repair RAD52-like protein 2, chloroplastic isoform X2 [Prosopis alba]